MWHLTSVEFIRPSWIIKGLFGDSLDLKKTIIDLVFIFKLKLKLENFLENDVATKSNYNLDNAIDAIQR